MDDLTFLSSHTSIISQDPSIDNAVLLKTNFFETPTGAITITQELSFATQTQVVSFILSGDMIILSEKLKNISKELDDVIISVISSVAERDAQNNVDDQPES